MKIRAKIQNDESRTAVLEALDQHMSIADLEPLGLATRTISGLESKLGIIYLEQLLEITFKDVQAAHNLGASAVREITFAINNLQILTNEFKENFRLQMGNVGIAKQMRNLQTEDDEEEYL